MDFYNIAQGYDPYGYWQVPEEPKETEADRLQREKEENERVEAIKENRLFLRKLKNQSSCEDFIDLKQQQLFLCEVMIVKLEVKGASTLGILPEDKDFYVAARVKFLNLPFVDMCENPIEQPHSREESHFTDHFQTLSEVKQKDFFASTDRHPLSGSQEDEADKYFPVTKWEKAIGKSFLFSKTTLELIQDLDRCPVVVQVSRCVDNPTTCDPIGYARVRLPDDFSTSVLQSCKNGVILPVTSVHRETADIVNVFNVKKGRLELHFRLSSFGPVICTSFQSINDYRQYVFKPGPLEITAKSAEEDLEGSEHIQALRPIIAEEETAVGISVHNELDIFQLPVLWRPCSSKRTEQEERNQFQCDYQNFTTGVEDIEPKEVNKYDCKKSQIKKVDKLLPNMCDLELPKSSAIGLCRNVLPPTDQKDLRHFGKTQCDWHNLVSHEIKNSPGGNCGCLDYKSTCADDDTGPKRISSRIMKIDTVSRSMIGVDMKQEKDDCKCDCPFLKEMLYNKKLFLI